MERNRQKGSRGSCRQRKQQGCNLSGMFLPLASRKKDEWGWSGLSDGSLEREQGGRQQARMMITDWARHEGNDFSMERSVSSSFQAVALCP
ncbi:hypothetical protein Cob_v006527 [Colletotrichum orbiculare MAFF 240422]|uniref:Uncharacterized protein n=1 Tax=Colletotrichum orbiculare (strain 104-T / ATCC 96160 / CBS 514.97 / LARS 414 / MAFF 240422) TaxID=1213857 RepID=A0A484FRJ6_COLOR|nr:hypothetical protein Cob_v006527 [Colletotrichum orbiculare MAFF 240422]